MLDLHGRLAVVVGAGPVGLRKVRSLQYAEARIRLVSPEIDPNADLTGVDANRRPYGKDVLEGAFLVFACTDDRELNGRIADDAREIGALVNVVDAPKDCDFYLPATLHDDDVVVAIGTGGAAPAVARWLKRRVGEHLPKRVGQFSAALDEIRTELKDSVADSPRRMRIMKQLASDETHEHFLRGGPAALRAELSDLMEG